MSYFRSLSCSWIILGGCFLGLSKAQASIPAVLTDSIRGSGVINLLRDVKPDALAQYLSTNGRLYLGVDLNEVSRSPQSPSSQGVAIQQMRLAITTTTGDFSFGDFYTSTTAMIRAAGADVPQQYQTLFGQTGSNDLRSTTPGFQLNAFDDVITLDNIRFTGDILSAQLDVHFLSTANDRAAGVNEQFFQFSAGAENFAILTRADAALLEAAGIGQADAPGGLTFSQAQTPLNSNTSGGGGNGSVPTTPGAPTPAFFLFLAAAALLGMKQWHMQRARVCATA